MQLTNSFDNKMITLMNNLVTKGVVKSESVYKAMVQVDRGEYINPKYAYLDMYI
jgi:hypothetical protein